MARRESPVVVLNCFMAPSIVVIRVGEPVVEEHEELPQEGLGGLR